ncbi:tryptophan--tRNA ligase [Holospora obtusa F1]|uniref:Tryptophan--tRNA ligase n=1 Tax=Holospora obtusa F1 TaxID=1399147 RepID=W6TIA7_HOLOB|nr:tryptophan--tRNA ligase [Holospora obtusa]ETZ07750.1 tryptophan--tRNA ligase [Holospora obtusa F1]
MKKRVLTGDRPTGKLHLGHYVGSLQNRVKFQEIFDQYVMIADVQALTDNFEDPFKITEHVFEVAKDYLSVGIDPDDSTIFIQSQIPEISELTMYYLNLVTLGRLERNPTVKAELQQKGYGDSVPVGFFCYPVNQAADISIFQAEIVPVGEDQVPMIEQTNEIVRRFNRIYCSSFLKECHAVLSKSPRLVGIDGKGKASKSLGNAIFLSDDAQEVKRKIFQMYTDPNHLKISDPGKIEGNVVFSYLDAFHPDAQEVSELKSHYQRGGLGDTTIKNILNDVLHKFLLPIRSRRLEYSKDDVISILEYGTKKARTIALETIERVREVIGVQYFKSNVSKE